MNNLKPTFGVSSPIVSVENKSRKDVGGIWKRSSKRNNSEFMSIRINLSKDRIKQLLDQEGDVVDIGFVAFPNNSKQDNTKRPDFRVYEDREE